MAKTYMALGSNLGDRMGYLQGAVDMLPSPKRCSRIYQTLPVDSPPDSGPFLNAVVEIEFQPDAARLLELVGRIEEDAGRVRLVRNGPRTLDVDVIYVNGFSSNSPEMTIPHPRARERGFVIAPLLDLNREAALELSPALVDLIENSVGPGPEILPGVSLYSSSLSCE